jgi:hypothetical protein
MESPWFTCTTYQGSEAPARVRGGFGQQPVVPDYPHPRSPLLLMHLKLGERAVSMVVWRFASRLVYMQVPLRLGMGRW